MRAFRIIALILTFVSMALPSRGNSILELIGADPRIFPQSPSPTIYFSPTLINLSGSTPATYKVAIPMRDNPPLLLSGTLAPGETKTLDFGDILAARGHDVPHGPFYFDSGTFTQVWVVGTYEARPGLSTYDLEALRTWQVMRPGDVAEAHLGAGVTIHLSEVYGGDLNYEVTALLADENRQTLISGTLGPFETVSLPPTPEGTKAVKLALDNLSFDGGVVGSYVTPASSLVGRRRGAGSPAVSETVELLTQKSPLRIETGPGLSHDFSFDGTQLRVGDEMEMRIFIADKGITGSMLANGAVDLRTLDPNLFLAGSNMTILPVGGALRFDANATSTVDFDFKAGKGMDVERSGSTVRYTNTGVTSVIVRDGLTGSVEFGVLTIGNAGDKDATDDITSFTLNGDGGTVDRMGGAVSLTLTGDTDATDDVTSFALNGGGGTVDRTGGAVSLTLTGDTDATDDVTSFAWNGGGGTVDRVGGAVTVTFTGDTDPNDELKELDAGTAIVISGTGTRRTITNTGDPSTADDLTELFVELPLEKSGTGNSRTITVRKASSSSTSPDEVVMANNPKLYDARTLRVPSVASHSASMPTDAAFELVSTGTAIRATGAMAADLNGPVQIDGPTVINGDVIITGTLTKGGGAFKIDHPLDPENRYLYHSFVESPDMKNIYDGVATLDENGEAWVELPKWFEALNKDFRYQLTAIGRPAPGIYIASKIEGNRFRIAGGEGGAEISWQVTGTREDAFAEANRIPVEEWKPEAQRGTYLHPEAFRVKAQEMP